MTLHGGRWPAAPFGNGREWPERDGATFRANHAGLRHGGGAGRFSRGASREQTGKRQGGQSSEERVDLHGVVSFHCLLFVDTAGAF